MSHSVGWSNRAAGAWAVTTSQSGAATPMLYRRRRYSPLHPIQVMVLLGVAISLTQSLWMIFSHSVLSSPGTPPHPLLRAHHSRIFLLCPLQPLLLPLLPADEDACGGHSRSNDGSNDAPNNATCGPCARCVGGLCEEKDSVKEF